MGRFGVGQSHKRAEDQRFLTGRGLYTDDVAEPGVLRAVVVRSLAAHARITVDVSAARTAPGVALVLTHGELPAAMVCDFMPKNRDGSKSTAPIRPILAGDTVRHVGEAVAFVVAETLAQARDAAELVTIDYEPLDLLDEEIIDWELGDQAATDAAFATAARVIELELVNNRVAPTALEPRGCLARPTTNGLELVTGSQGVHAVQDALCRIMGLDKASLRVVSPDVGGGFGLKLAPFPEHVMALAAARRLGRPVKWVAERSECFSSDTHGRDHVSRARLAVDASGRMLALAVETTANLGAYVSVFGAFIPTHAGSGMLTGVYAIPALHVRVRCKLTNTAPTDAYRGAGRPEAAYLIERLVDFAAHRLGQDPAEFRRLNYIPESAMPYRTAGGKTYDSGEFARVMDLALERADRNGFAARRAEAKARGRLRGLGFAYYIEVCGGTGGEDVTLSIRQDGSAEILVGTQSSGQGHETVFAQMVAAELGLDIGKISVVQGDTARIATGGGTGGSRSLSQQGGAIATALDDIIGRAKPAAARLLQADQGEVTFAAGTFTAGGRSVSFREVAGEGALASSLRFKPPASTFPNGCHVCEVEIDPATGETRIERYTIVDDVGVVMNPLLLKGQIVGGAVQGMGQALCEHALYDPDSGQLLTGSLVDYAVPHATMVPEVDFSYVEIPCRSHPLGIKGAGEAGTIGAPPAVVNAVIDALRPLGISHVDMPATPLKLWSLIKDTR